MELLVWVEIKLILVDINQKRSTSKTISLSQGLRFHSNPETVLYLMRVVPIKRKKADVSMKSIRILLATDPDHGKNVT